MQQETGGNIAVRVKDYTVHVDFFFLSLRNITDTREGIDRREAKKKKKILFSFHSIDRSNMNLVFSIY